MHEFKACSSCFAPTQQTVTIWTSWLLPRLLPLPLPLHVHADDHLKLQPALGYHHADISHTIQRLGKYCRAPAKPAAAKDPTAPAIMAALGPLVDLNRPADTKPGTKKAQSTE